MASDDEYLSDLTSIESDDEVVVKGKKTDKKAGWKVRQALTPARATTYSAQALYGAQRLFFSRFLSRIFIDFRPNSLLRY